MLSRSTTSTWTSEADEGFGPFAVDADYMGKHKPRIGGYYVVYDDGYRSWSPAEAFEKGYVRIDGTHSPLSELAAALKASDDYAWTWLCNLACIAIDAGADHKSANHYAAQFMRNAFDVDVRKQEQWKTFQDNWAGTDSFSAQCDTQLTKLQAVINSPRKRTYEEMQSLSERLRALADTVAAMELAEYTE